jgi:sugar O-acyltransferase (sialic acid O-acetyltransferase NeuD family)
MNKVIIFGTEQLAQLANYYLINDSKYDVVCFTVHKKYKTIDNFENKKVIEFDNIENVYPPSEYMLFAPMSGKGLNKIRENVYNEGKKKGYKFISYISSKSTILTDKIGENCFILEENTIQPFVEIGNNCIIWSGNHIGHHSIINENVFITSHCVISGNCCIKPYSWLGVNCSIRNGIVIEEGTLIAMSASVIKSTDKYTIYMGVPAKPSGKSDDIKVSMSL